MERGVLQAEARASITVSAAPTQTLSKTSVGQCHATNLLSRPEVTWAYVSGANVFWSTLEPQKGVYNWNASLSPGQTKSLDEEVNSVPSGKKIWIQVTTSTPGNRTVPNWAMASDYRTPPERAKKPDGVR